MRSRVEGPGRSGPWEPERCRCRSHGRSGHWTEGATAAAAAALAVVWGPSPPLREGVVEIVRRQQGR